MNRQEQDVLATETEGVRTITLNRPDSLNAINVSLLSQLVRALHEAQDARAVVLTGTGRAFCTGEDLKQTLAPQSGKPDELRRSFELLQEVTRAITRLKAPVVAAVHGYAVGGGAEIALAADLVVLQKGTRIRFPEVPIGHAHTGGITLRLPQIVGLMRAKELLLRGRWIESTEAVALGLAIEETADASARAHELAAELAGQPPRSLAAAKHAIETATFPMQEANLRMEVDAATYCFASIEADAAFEDFKLRGNVAGARS
ncbi:enoyl-CoA hydratase/isomerase family protein [Dactylosporangium sp. CA-233914]|uniref:enoyl-CoA hydratase/isomerase family protein n=1 Tax=Dactylosporangium sp. CA-233914 TaxID=3239934 RepID=UPI003D91B3B7